MADGQGRTALITGFAGENYQHAESLLPPNVSPDALNCDYSRGTVRKRFGWECAAAPRPGSDAESMILGIYNEETSTPGRSDDWYSIVASEGTSKIDLQLYKAGTLIATESNAMNGTLRPFRTTKWNSMGMWGAYKLPSFNSLVIDPIDVSSTYVNGVASGSGTLSGVRKYRVVARNSTDGHESDLDYSDIAGGSAQVESLSLSNVTGIQFSNLPSSSDSQVDKIRLYATKMDGDVFYYLDDLDNTGSGYIAYTDTATDDELTVPYNSYRGALPSLSTGEDRMTPLLWQERLWALGYEDNEYVLKWSERDYGDGLPLYCLFYPDNYLALRGTSDFPMDALPVGDQYILLAFRNGLYAIVGNSPDDYRCVPVEVGAAFYRLAMSDQYCYAFGPGGVVRFPLGTLGPVEDISGPIRPLLREALYPGGSTVRHPVSQYVHTRKEVWFTTSFGDPNETTDFLGVFGYGDRKTFVWNEETSSWAVWDLPFDQFGEHSRRESQDYMYFGVQGTLGRTTLGKAQTVNPESEQYHDGISETGTVTSSTSSTVVVSESPAEAVALYRGVFIRVIAPDGTVQTRTIDSRSGTTINVIGSWDTNPTSSYTYTIGAIDWYWTAPRLALTDDRFAMKRTHRLKTAFDTESSVASEDVTVEYRFDENTEQSKTLDGSERHQEIIADDVGREFRLKYSNAVPGESVEIEGIQIELEMQE